MTQEDKQLLDNIWCCIEKGDFISKHMLEKNISHLTQEDLDVYEILTGRVMKIKGGYCERKV